MVTLYLRGIIKMRNIFILYAVDIVFNVINFLIGSLFVLGGSYLLSFVFETELFPLTAAQSVTIYFIMILLRGPIGIRVQECRNEEV